MEQGMTTENGYAVLVDVDGDEISERMHGTYRMRLTGDVYIIEEYPDGGDFEFKIKTDGVVCRMVHRLANGVTVNDRRLFRVEPGDRLSIPTGSAR